MLQRPDWTVTIKTALGTITILSVLYTFFGLGPELETRYAPVLTPLRLVKVLPLNEHSALVSVDFQKLRDCEYIGTAWYKIDKAEGFERVSMTPIRDPDDTSSPNRPLGFQRAGPWRVGMPASEIRFGSFVHVFHRCHPFWTTRTQFFPPT